MLYFFHVADDAFGCDGTGTEYAGRAEASVAAIEYLGDVVREKAHALKDGGKLRVTLAEDKDASRVILVLTAVVTPGPVEVG